MKIESLDTAAFAQQIVMEDFAMPHAKLRNILDCENNKNLTNDFKHRKNLLTPTEIEETHKPNFEESQKSLVTFTENKETEIKNEEKEVNEENKVYKWDIVWVNVFLLGTLHLGALYGLYLKCYTIHFWTLGSFIIKSMGLAASVGITAGAHRLWTHKAYKVTFPLECLLMFMATLTYQNSIYIWARDHRLHHKCSETDGDPHNAKRGFFFSHVGWLMVKKHPEVIRQGKSIDMSDLKANPLVMFQHKYYYPLVFFCAFFLPFTIAYYAGIPANEAFFICVCYKYVVSVNLTWCINSVAHMFGHKPYDKNIGPTESQVMKYLGLGEGFHNYHHTFPWDYKAGEFGNDTRNLTTTFINFFAWLGWAYDLRVASPEVIEKRCQRTGGSGREYHMLKYNLNRTIHNVASFILFFFYIYYM